MVLETHLRIRLDVAHGSQRQGRKQVLVTKTAADPSGELARKTLSRRFFQQFEHNPLAKELLDAILEKYIQGDASDVTNMELLKIPPLSARTSREWNQAFSLGSPKTGVNAALKELQKLLYSV